LSLSLSSCSTVHAGSISRRLYPYLFFFSLYHLFFSDHFQIVHPSLSWLSNGAFSFCDILTHFLHSFFFWHSFHMP
jgi:hypothetical protein